MTNTKTFIIVGRTGSGKSTIAQKLIELIGLDEIVQDTTRPRRNDEIDGVHYNFRTLDQFLSRSYVIQELFHAEFGDVWYGVSRNELNKSNKTKILVTSPKSALDLRFKLGQKNCKIIYVNSPAVMLVDRLSERGDKLVEIERRIASDTRDLYEFEFMADKYIRNVDLSNALFDTIKYIKEVENE